MTKATACYDIVIVGRGLVGASLALALEHSGLRIAIIDAVAPNLNPSSPLDQRSIALTYGSQQIFSSIGLWDELMVHATAIQQIHVSQKGQFGATRLQAKVAEVDALGYVIGIEKLVSTLYQALDKSTITHYVPATVKNVNISSDKASLEVEQAGETVCLDAKLVVAADGSQSKLRELLHIAVTEKDYEEYGVVTQIALSQSHQQTAYERFTPQGTVAMLPLEDRYCGLVWSVTEAEADTIRELSDADFLDRLQHVFGLRLGRFTSVGKRSIYPLKMQQADEQIRSRFVLLGNAAHTLHPVAAQGFNLSLRDVAALAEVLMDNQEHDIGQLDVLERYTAWCLSDQKKTIQFTDALVRVWRHDFFPLTLLRSSGLLALDNCPLLKQLFTQQTMGLISPMPKLTRGVALC